MLKEHKMGDRAVSSKSLSPEERIILFPTFIFVFSIYASLLYFFITRFNWRIATGVLIIGILLNLFIFVWEKTFALIYRTKEEAQKKSKMIGSYLVISLFFIFVLGSSFFICKSVFQDFQKRSLIKKVSPSEAAVSIEKSRQEIVDALNSLQSSTRVLTNVRDSVDLLINQSEEKKVQFVKQIDQLNDSSALLEKLNNRMQEQEGVLENISHLIDGKKVLTIEDYERGKIIDFTMAFVVGILATIASEFILKAIKSIVSDLKSGCVKKG